MRLAEIELALDPASRLVLELAATEQPVDVVALGRDQHELDVVLQRAILPVGASALPAGRDA